MRAPRTRYAKTPDGAHIAYSVSGDGPDLAYLPGAFGDIELWWEGPGAPFFSRLAESFRLIFHDPRGAGMSDGERLPELERRSSDFMAVLDAIDSQACAFYAVTVGGHLPILLGSTSPQRVSALAWYLPYAKFVRTDTHPFGVTPERYEKMMDKLEETWGDPEHSWRLVGDLGVHPTEESREFTSRMERRFCSPDRAEENTRIVLGTDVRRLLPTFRVPNVLLISAGSTDDTKASADFIAGQMPEATIEVLPGSPGISYQLAEPITESIERLLGVGKPVALDRILATVLFTDIVGSTPKAAEIGDARWKTLLAAYDEKAKSELSRFRGRFVDSAGDGMLATFDGPARAVRCAAAIAQAVRDLGVEIRAGVHTGEVELVGNAVRGLAVHIGARVAAAAGPSEILASSTVKDLTVGSGLVFEDAGEHELKGVPDVWHLYRVVG